MQLEVLSLQEGLPTHFHPLFPKLVIVPLESGYPGFGGLVLLRDLDHINTCKPRSTEDLAYKTVRDFLGRLISRVHIAPGMDAEVQ